MKDTTAQQEKAQTAEQKNASAQQKSTQTADQKDRAKDQKAREKERKKKERAERRALRRYRFAFAFFRFFMTPFIKLKFRYRYDSLKKIKGPYLLLANHNMEMDPILLGIAARRQAFFVASEHIARKGFGTWFLMRYFHPILHRKGKDGARSVMTILKTLRSGSSVTLFPEGNRSFDGVTCPIPEATGKMAKHAGVPVITYRFEGGYLSQPRFSLTLRKGRVTGHLVRVYQPEELKAMTDEQVIEAIAADLREDAYETQEREKIAFKGKKLARGIESTLYRCPKCGRFGTLQSDDKTVRCDCGYEAEYDVYGYVGGETMRDLNASQREALRQRLWDAMKKDADTSKGEELAEQGQEASDSSDIFRDTVTVRRIGADHEVLWEREGAISADCGGVYITGEQGEQIEVRELAVYSRNAIAAHCTEELVAYDVRGDERFCALKYLHLHEEVQAMRMA
ncbi:MAG: 1-acyl-sn-glycerol-3-phosphate acyltransferase [Lachnospiraceae bacterium]|nr:1-acyl-sn-glycerol-3-phosphate acyltransferase [Lachnospiraceae bacterium]